MEELSDAQFVYTDHLENLIQSILIFHVVKLLL